MKMVTRTDVAASFSESMIVWLYTLNTYSYHLSVNRPVVSRAPEANAPRFSFATQPAPDPVLEAPIAESVVNEPHKQMRIGVTTAKTRISATAAE